MTLRSRRRIRWIRSASRWARSRPPPAPAASDDTKKSAQDAADKARAQLDSMTPKPGDSDEVLKEKLKKLNDFNNSTSKPGT